MNIGLGTEITGCWGAMHSESIGHIVEIDKSCFGKSYRVEWEDGGRTDWIMEKEIRDDYFDVDTANIGYFAVDTDRAWDWVYDGCKRYDGDEG